MTMTMTMTIHAHDHRNNVLLVQQVHVVTKIIITTTTASRVANKKNYYKRLELFELTQTIQL